MRAKPCISRQAAVRRRPARIAAFVAAAGLIAAVSATVTAAAATAPSVIRVVGTGNPSKDVPNINNALAAAGSSTTVQLVGHFNVGDSCRICIKINHPVTIVGTGDPSVAHPNPFSVTIIEGGARGGATVPFWIFKPGAGTVSISKLWFDHASLGEVWFDGTTAQSRIVLSNNRFTDVRPVTKPVEFTFPIAGGWKVTGRNIIRNEEGELFPVPPAGQLVVDHNYFNSNPRPFFGDDDCIAMAHWAMSQVTITNNTLSCRSDVIEIEGGVNESAQVLVADNDITEDSAPSPEGILYPPGGHPEAIKIMANLARRIYVLRNQVLQFGNNKGVCILFAAPLHHPPTPGSDIVADNTCTMHGMTAGLLAGYNTGGPFYPRGTMQNTVIVGNTFKGSAKYGIAFLDYKPPLGSPPVFGLTNNGNHNIFIRNNLSKLKTPVGLYFGPATYDNVYFGKVPGRLVDKGTNNVVVQGNRGSRHALLEFLRGAH
jgi:hypothetical protein